MESFEKDYINDHLYDLTTNTICNSSLLILLRQKRLISPEEKEHLANPNLTSIAAAEELYKIVATRQNGYNLLIEALHKSEQTGAANVLLNAPHGVIPPENLIVEQAALLLDFKVQIWEKTYAFREIFPKLSTECLTEILRDSQINKEFRKLQNMSPQSLNLQGYTPPLRPFYIPRSISNRLLLKKELFKCNKVEDVFVFNGIGWKDLTELINPHLLQSSTSQRWSITCRHIYLDHEDDWNDILQVAKTPVHLVNFDGENYVLQRSNRATNILLEYSYRGEEQKHPYVSEDEFVGQISTECNGMLLCDVPGMGKTWLMESLAKKIQGVSADRFVFIIPAPLLANYLEEKQWNSRCNNNLVLILEYACKSKLVTSVLCASGNINTPMLVFVCDGFDEIIESSVEKTTSFLKDLTSEPNVKLLISSRPHKRKYLETTFELASFDILPLCPKEQISYLCQHWQRNLGADEKNFAFEEFASHCFKSLKILEADPIIKLLGTPLICSLVAVINEENVKRLSASNPNRPLVVPENVMVNSISELYEMFVNFCLRNIPEDGKETIIDYHVYHALKLLFPDLANAYIRAKQIMMMFDLVVERFGIISRGGEFLHRSFAEYFVGKCFADVYQNLSVFDTEFVSLVGGKFVKELLRDYGWRWMPDIMSMCEPYEASSVAGELQYPIVLHFMNGELKKNLNQQSLSILVADLSHAHLKLLKSLLCSSINAFLFVTIALNLQKLISFYVNLTKTLFSNNEEKIAFVTGGTPLSAYSRLLCFAAKYGSPATVNHLYSLYDNSEGNWLTSKFKHYIPSDSEESPLEIAIKRNDIDLVECFYGKVFMRTERVCKAFLTKDNFESDDKILRIMDRVLPPEFEICDMTQNVLSEEETAWRFFKKTLKDEIDNFCRLIIKLAYMRRTSLTSLNKTRKAKVTSRIMTIGNDEIFIKTLLLLFHKDTLGKFNRKFETGINNDQHLTKLPANQILSLLSVTAVKETLDNRYTQWGTKGHDKLANITGLETLKVLLAICPSFTHYDDYERNYMHLSVHQNKLNWVGYLIKLGHDVNEKVNYGNTPLLSVSTKTEPEIVTCLVQKGADIYIARNNGNNFLHCLLSSVRYSSTSSTYTVESFPPQFFSTWIKFIFINKFNKLLEMKDSDGLTPISLLAQQYNEQADLVFSMYGECQLMPPEVKVAFLERSILWSNDRELIKLLVKMFPVGENPFDTETDHLHHMNNSDTFPFNSDIVLQIIDVKKAKETAQNVLIWNFVTRGVPTGSSFKFIESTDALKILLKIIPDFSCKNFHELNYMHISVAQGKVEWLEHLIALGHDVNQQDKEGNTPVFYLSEKNTMVLIRLLVERRANLRHTNCDNEIFAHEFLTKEIQKDLVIEWTRYMLEIGAHDIWHIRNKNSWDDLYDTPLELLSCKLGEDHPTTLEVLDFASRPSRSNYY